MGSVSVATVAEERDSPEIETVVIVLCDDTCLQTLDMSRGISRRVSRDIPSVRRVACHVMCHVMCRLKNS